MKRASLVSVAYLALATAGMSAPLPAQSQREAALSVIENARVLCDFEDSGGQVTVRCPTSIPVAQRLAFVRAIADADAVLTGRARHIVFRLTGGAVFAEASPQTGVHLVTQSASPPPRRSVNRTSAIAIGTLADTVLAIKGRATSTKQIGRDAHGLLVEWHYPDFTYLMARREKEGVTAYRVIKITPRR